MAGPFLGGAEYLLILVDGFSWFLWIYTIKSKDETVEMFKEFKSLVENHNNNKNKFIRIDCGDKHFGDVFHLFLTS